MLLLLTLSASLHVFPARLDVVTTQASQECLQMFFWNSDAHKSISFLVHMNDLRQTLLWLQVEVLSNLCTQTS